MDKILKRASDLAETNPSAAYDLVDQYQAKQASKNTDALEEALQQLHYVTSILGDVPGLVTEAIVHLPKHEGAGPNISKNQLDEMSKKLGKAMPALKQLRTMLARVYESLEDQDL
jgi:Cdc6-like AAA superfamily ATPase